ncbi:enoyl-CoA delta isomerase 1, mitochondrial-like [Euwallacea fornicatus]|uniref:enoyl-CoA delta isomerase 1, mitochondrial-like n=1 Tax=Euwallacea fornicatus TaxID=995702 RepID=UPI00338FB835
MALSNIYKFKPFMSLARCYSSAHLVNVQVNNKTGISVLTLESSPVNSLNLELLSELKQSLSDLEKNHSRGVIITSALKTFSAGLDINEMYKPDLDRCKRFWTTLQDVWISLYGSSFPTVAVINGAAPAGGCLLSMSCEYRVMVPNSVIGLNETQLGIVAPQWFTDTMCNVIGPRKTELALTEGKLFTTNEALNVGLIDEIVQTKEEGLEKANEFLKKFVRISPVARSMSKKIIRGDTLQRMVQARDADLKLFIRTVTQESVQKSLGMYIEALKKKQTA